MDDYGWLWMTMDDYGWLWMTMEQVYLLTTGEGWRKLVWHVRPLSRPIPGVWHGRAARSQPKDSRSSLRRVDHSILENWFRMGRTESAHNMQYLTCFLLTCKHQKHPCGKVSCLWSSQHEVRIYNMYVYNVCINHKKSPAYRDFGNNYPLTITPVISKWIHEKFHKDISSKLWLSLRRSHTKGGSNRGESTITIYQWGISMYFGISHISHCHVWLEANPPCESSATPVRRSFQRISLGIQRHCSRFGSLGRSEALQPGITWCTDSVYRWHQMISDDIRWSGLAQDRHLKIAQDLLKSQADWTDEIILPSFHWFSSE